MVLGNLAIPAGVEVILPLCGALIATGHIQSLPLAIVAAVLGEIVGGSLLWAIGRYGGVAFVQKFGRYVHLHEDALARIHVFYERFGSRTVFICRFIPVIRGIAALPAGLSGMNIAPFLAYTFLGSAIFCGGLIGVGYFLGKRVDRILPLVHQAGLGILAVFVLVILLAVFAQRRHSASRAAAKAAKTS